MWPATSTVDGAENMLGAFRPTQPSLVGLLWYVFLSPCFSSALIVSCMIGRPHGSCHVRARRTFVLASSRWTRSLRRSERVGFNAKLWCVVSQHSVCVSDAICVCRTRLWSCRRSMKCHHGTSIPSSQDTPRAIGRVSTKFPNGQECVPPLIQAIVARSLILCYS